jgi:cytochrome c peroxidase
MRSSDAINDPQAKPKADLVLLATRTGLGLAFLLLGVDKVEQPGSWVMFVPTPFVRALATSGVISLEQVLHVQGVLEAVLGTLLLAGLATRVVAGVTSLVLIAIVAHLGLGPVGARDLGLLGAALALTLAGGGRFSLGTALARLRGARAAVAGGVGARWWIHAAWLGIAVAVGTVRLPRETPPEEPDVVVRPSIPEDAPDPRYANLPIPPLPRALDTDPAKVALGRKLFHESRLSRDQTVACATCHDLTKGGADGRRVSTGIGGEVGDVNAPTVLNAALNFKQFWDGRADTLEAQAEGPLLNPKEMGSRWDDILARLRGDEEYVALFARAFPDGVTAANVTRAIAEFERTLLTPDAPFDRYLRGDAAALTDQQRQGFERFTALGCISCHQGVNVGGNIFQTMGKMEDYFAGRPVRPADLGRFNVTQDPRDRHKFKVPSLRNVALTAPYFHDGSAATLPEAVTAMARYQLGYTLTESETASIVAFLETLTGRTPAG